LAAQVSNLSNLSLRLITAGILSSAFLLALFAASGPVWLAFIALFMTGAAWEWAGLMKLGSRARLAYAATTALMALAVSALGITALLPVYLPALMFWVLLAPIWLERGWNLPTSWLGLLLGWVLLLSTLLALLLLHTASPYLLLAVVGIAIVADTAAYFSGRAFGRHKLAPAISPGKTWEGAVGGALAVAIYALLLPSPAGIGKMQLVVAALFLCVLSVLGDLFESWIKRRAGVKDSSQLLPGHGGILDRIDSQLAVLPVAAFIWIWLS
jgi:phosphatidate cytidylyltransferase